MRVLDWNTLDADGRRAALARPAQEMRGDILNSTREIVETVRRDGDAALRAYTQRFDGVQLDDLAVTGAELAAARRALRPEQIAALERAVENVRAFHAPQLPGAFSLETMPGVVCERLIRPIPAVGLYVPAGSAPLPSAVVMLAIPAQLAGCPQRVLCTPPTSEGGASPAVLVAAELCGVETIFKVGGAQAIAAMAYGTKSIPKVDKIFGPGNAWVTAAKQLVAGDPAGAAFDLPAGPSEVLVIADDSASADLVAADLLAQAEHDPQAQAILITPSRALAEAVSVAVDAQMRVLSRRAILEMSVASSRCIVVSDLNVAIAVANEYAAEHLILQVREPRRFLPQIQNAGSIFVGPWSPEPMGDYCSGTNHVLPTYGYARAYSGLSVLDFVKRVTVQELTPDGLRALGPVAVTLAQLEGLDAHASAVSKRLALLNGETSEQGSEAMSWIREIARPEIVALNPYEHASWEPHLERLHANELPWRADGDNTEAGLNRYPEPQPRELVARLASLYGAEPNQVLVGRGSDEHIDLLVRSFCRAGRDAVVICPPTFGMYAVAARIQGADVISVPLQVANGFALDIDAVLQACTPAVKLVFLCSPNNPTGNLIKVTDVLNIAAQLEGRALVVVDEAYIEFAGVPSLIRRVKDLPQLAVMRTLSKAHGLAGARCGTLVANPEIISLLRKVIPPYAITQLTVEAALYLLEPAQVENMHARISEIRRERERMTQAVVELPGVKRVWPSQANFILVEFADPARALAYARAANLLIRDVRAQVGLPRTVRISIGTAEQNDRLLEALK